MLKSIGMIGDSIAHGYCDEEDLGWFARLGKLVAKKGGEDYLFANISQAGDNIADATYRALFEVSSRHFDLILVNVGINDLRRRKNSDLQLDFSEGVRIMYWNKLFDILATSKAKIVVLDLIPIIENRYMEQASLFRYNSDVERYNQIIREICEQRNIAFFARYDKWKKLDIDNLYKDAIHPNSEGHRILAAEVYKYLDENKFI